MTSSSINTSTSDPLISLIIPFSANRRKEYIKHRAIELIEATYPSFVEPIFVDSTRDIQTKSELIDKCKQFNRKYIESNQSEEYSLAKARNDGALSAQSPYLFFFDVDFVWSDSFWRHLWQQLNHSQCGKKRTFTMLPCLFLSQSGTNLIEKNRSEQIFSDIRDEVLLGMNTNVDTIALVSSTIIVETNTFISIGGFNEDYLGYGCEEFDILHRLDMLSPIGKRNNDYYTDDVQQLPGDYVGFRKYFTYYGLPALYGTTFLLHRFHDRPITDKFYMKRKKNNQKLIRNMKAYDSGYQLKPLSSSFNRSSSKGTHDLQELPPLKAFITETQLTHNYPIETYFGLLYYTDGVAPKRGSFQRRLRKLFRNPRKYFADARKKHS